MRQARTGIIIHDAVPLEKILELAQRADEKGFWGVLMTEEAGHNTLMALAAIAQRTRRVHVGSGICSVFTRSAAIYAMGANTLNTLSHGRAILGLSTSPPFFVKHWHHARWEHPISRVRDYILIVRRILEGDGKLDYQGKAVEADDFIFACPRPAAKVPLWIGAIGPQMIELAGEVADGVLLSPLLSEEYLEFAVKHVKIGAERGKRDWREVEIAAPIITTVDPDGGKALEWGRSMLTYFSIVYYFNQLYLQSGHGEFHKKLGQLNKDKGYLAARDSVSDEIVRKFSICGTPEDCRTRTQELRAAGLALPIHNAPGPRRIYGQSVRVPVPEWQLAENIVTYLP
jgi:5,10-methylenetetrahydromethanopterin reductase